MKPRSCSLLAALLMLCFSSSLVAQLPAGPGDWPQWRGPNRDGHALDKGLLKQWPEQGPRSLWQIDSVGVGYSSVAVKGGRVYTMGDLEGVEHIIALDAQQGQIIWAVQPEPVARRLDERVAGEIKQLDRDQDGQVSEAEALDRLGWNFNKYDRTAVELDLPRRASRLLQTLDQDRDGVLSFPEAGKLFREHFGRMDQPDKDQDAASLARRRSAALVARLDQDQDGRLSRKETNESILQPIFRRADQRDPATQQGDEQLTPAELEKYFTESEAGRDGKISSDELAAYYSQNRLTGDGVLSAEELRGFYGGYRDGQGDGPRGTPTLEGDLLYAEGANGDVCCLEAATGATRWHVNLVEDLGGGRPGWGYSESPLIDGDLLIVTPGGKRGTVAALNKFTGELVWQSEGVTEGAQYSSPIRATIGGIPQIVQFARSNVFGVSRDGGKPLWKYGGANNGTANCCTPIVAQDHVFVASAYGTGGGLAKVTTANGEQTAEQVYFEKKMAIHHGGIVKVGDYLYSNGAGALICINFLTGEIAWQARGVGKGSLIYADGMLYLLSERQEVALVEATPEEYREHGRFKFEGHGRPSWAHPVVSGGRLYVRDQQSLAAYDVRGT